MWGPDNRVSFRRLLVGPQKLVGHMPADFNWAIGGEGGDGVDSTGEIFSPAPSRGGGHVLTS